MRQRRIIQIAVAMACSDNYGPGNALWALADDGTLWEFQDDDEAWVEIPPLPPAEEAIP